MRSPYGRKALTVVASGGPGQQRKTSDWQIYLEKHAKVNVRLVLFARDGRKG